MRNFSFLISAIKTNVRLSLGVLLVVSAFAFPAFADTTSRVFDKEGRVVEIWKEKDGLIEVYNPDMSRKGYIRKEGDRLERYDRNWKREGSIRDNEIPAFKKETQP